MGLADKDGRLYNDEAGQQTKKSTARVYDDFRVRYVRTEPPPLLRCRRRPAGLMAATKVGRLLQASDVQHLLLAPHQVQAPRRLGARPAAEPPPGHRSRGAAGRAGRQLGPVPQVRHLGRRRRLRGRRPRHQGPPVCRHVRRLLRAARLLRRRPQQGPAAAVRERRPPRAARASAETALQPGRDQDRLHARVHTPPQDERLFVSTLDDGGLGAADFFDGAARDGWHLVPSAFEWAADGRALLIQAEDRGAPSACSRPTSGAGSAPVALSRHGSVAAFYPLGEPGAHELLVTWSSLTESSQYLIVDTNHPGGSGQR